MADGDVLRIEPGAAERIARAFDTHAENLDAIAARLRNEGFSTGFAGFPSAQELDTGFRNKCRLAIEHLHRQAETARRHASAVRVAGANYASADMVNASSIAFVGYGAAR